MKNFQYVTSLFHGLEKELYDDPRDVLSPLTIQQYPMEDILEKYGVGAG